MKHFRSSKSWMILLIGVILAVHGLALYHLHAHLTWTLFSVLVLVVLLKHLGIFGPLYGLFRRHSRRS